MKPPRIELDRAARFRTEQPLQRPIEVPREFLMQAPHPAPRRLLHPERLVDLPVQLVEPAFDATKLITVPFVLLHFLQQLPTAVNVRLVPGDVDTLDLRLP